MHSANKLIWIQCDEHALNSLAKGFVINKTLIPNFSGGVSEVVGNLFMYPQESFIVKENKRSSCTALRIYCAKQKF